ncbi:MAG: hypothetical protein PQJ61_13050 [Spirochaetales bacterium]|uniref:Uncharacterized protein n=1 Tax=Candidatus Thalassospirochaeta sargassi TaxID=3119039 RepID=A0AAJ1MLB2_9SPIO|nr:hypothetical protein [Spirochaetales bacterium]
MDIEKAVDQISEIHSHLAKSETFYGFKPLILLLVGLTAMIVAGLQSWLMPSINDMIFLLQWLVVGVVIIVIIYGNIIYNYLRYGSNFEIHQMTKVCLQFVPSLVAGTIVTAVILLFEKSSSALLPGLWAILFGLGIFSMRPYLPRYVGFIALYYFIVGGVLMYLTAFDLSFSPWGMGLTFGVGHLLAALIMHLGIERNVK